MARRTTIEKKQIGEAAVALIREKGHEALNARAVAAYLGCSTQPIFSNFSSMAELKEYALRQSLEIYNAFIGREMQSPEYPTPYKASGMGYIKFAMQEKNLFKFLFMRDRSTEKEHAEESTFSDIIPVIMKGMGIDEATARRFHLSMWIVVHGIASMVATNYVDIDLQTISETVSEAYAGIRKAVIGDAK